MKFRILSVIVSLFIFAGLLHADDYLEMLKNGTWEQRITAMYTLGYSGNKKAFWYLVKYLDQSFQSDNQSLAVRVRQAAAISLGRLKDDRAIPYLVDRYKKEENTEVKRAILFALRFFKPTPEAIAVVKQGLADSNKDIKWEALMASCAYCDSSLSGEIGQLAQSDDPEIKVITAYIQYMLNQNKQENESIMRKSLTHKQPLVRYWASHFLTKSVGTAALEDIMKALEIESVWWVANEMENSIYILARKKFNDEMVEQLGSFRFVVDKKEKQEQQK
ncbi:MAG: HEAT repeat domain-containing protein [Spirochaetes bacterium]|nr:HEAT repeat domain-containing protein [Spirochaetota bacterium]